MKRWRYFHAERNGSVTPAPPKELIVDAILRAVYGTNQSEPEGGDYQLPENLEGYYSARARKDAIDCQG